jgi:hypothetical protein
MRAAYRYQITLAAWVMLLGSADQAGQKQYHGIIGMAGSDSGYRLLIRDSDKVIYFQLTGKNGYNLLTKTAITAGAWYHIAATYDGSFMRVYINGVEDPVKVARTGHLDPSSAPLIIGKPEFALNGIIDDVRIYNRALSADEVQAPYQWGQ